MSKLELICRAIFILTLLLTMTLGVVCALAMIWDFNADWVIKLFFSACVILVAQAIFPPVWGSPFDE